MTDHPGDALGVWMVGWACLKVASPVSQCPELAMHPTRRLDAMARRSGLSGIALLSECATNRLLGTAVMEALGGSEQDFEIADDSDSCLLRQVVGSRDGKKTCKRCATGCFG